jgi:hypothetical protein
MQKLISLLLITILTIFPILSASASVNYCQHDASQSTIQTSAVEKTIQSMDMSSAHDCCAGVSLCDHGACDCDNGQAAYSFSSTTQVSVVSSLPQYKEIISNFFISKNSDSLYRPPISLL